MNRTRLKMLAGFLTAIVSLSLCWMAAFYITDFIYSYLDISFRPFLTQLINSLLGFFIFSGVMFVIARFSVRQRNNHIEFFQSITDAMKQIATGDYNVNLNKISGHDNPGDPFGEIVDNINYMAKELGEMEQMRQEFVSNVSHEIQSPLTSISGFARALQSDKLNQDERQHYLSIIETESQRLSKISDNLLKLTYLESEHHLFEVKQYRLDKQIRNSVLSCEPQWTAKNIEMNLSLEKTDIVADKELLDQVWMNLLNNAIKFTPDEGNIHLSLYHQQNQLIFEITDTGIGITEEEQLHLFERFYKADKARIRNAGGSGLGLSIVKKIIDMHEGTILVKSKPKEGTTFKISFGDYPHHNK
ncbi:sensor histidine kinase [Oceanobacillus neutriphilus]|uniref:histidine kinase n=1 Tax=Oceanobacillus neutriphilus TaxID=531815 RepID=A0ABQ2NWX8_9BACI|nr:HAMP domain-containing sensor histidine kinase [Oceanobacillus neutriphilus]GGP12598.1 two-component sensor histidine kinase [Oceanobacillus neutriphilus]